MIIDKIDVVMTATIRPEIIDLTLQSFKMKFLYQFREVRLVVNIDPIGDDSYTQQDVIDVCKKYFDNLVCNTPADASFPQAVKWCWEQVRSDYFFHLEDDWLLKKDINKNTICSYFDDSSVKSVRLYLSNNNKLLFEHGYVLSNGFSLNPSMIKTSFIKDLLISFDDNKDPEKQYGYLTNCGATKFLAYGSKDDGYFTIDIGKKWRKLRNFSKPNISISKDKTWLMNQKNFSVFNYLNYHLHLWYWRWLIKGKFL
jgi:hypothetical protein